MAYPIFLPGFRMVRGEDLSQLNQAGGGGTSALFGTEGNINVQTVSAGLSPASTGADIVLAAFTLPVGVFDQAGRGINIMACGSIVNNANTKTLKIIAGATTAVVGSAVTGGTAIASAAFTTAGTGWQLAANVFKYGASGSNTQIALHESAQAGSVVGALISPSLLTLNESASILCAVTGNAATATSDIVFNFLCANWMN